jgi:signal transduction histidine kinase
MMSAESSPMFKNTLERTIMKGSRQRRSRHRRHDRDFDDGAADAEDTDGDADRGFDDETNERLAAIDESLLSEEDRAYRLAQKLADRKVALSRQAFRAALITVPLLIFIPFAGAVSLIYFGVGIGRKAFRLLYEPHLREKFLQEEVHRRVHTRVSTERRSLEGEHHRSLEQLSASIAHEIRNPITAAKSLVQQIGEDPNGPDQIEYARVAVAELERVEKSISHLLRFAREEETQMSEVVLEDVLESALETFRDRSARGGIKIIRKYDTDGRLNGDAEQLRRVAINLVGNAIDALEESSIDQPEVRVSMGENLAGSEVWIRFADNGLGIEDDVRSQIFDPFYTSREAGTGLGLALCRKIVDNHGGSIEVETTSGEGTQFILVFPKPSESEVRIS